MRRRDLLLAAIDPGPFGTLFSEAERIGRQSWRPMLKYLAAMHQRGTHAAEAPFPHPWEEIGPGYHGRAFGHWDVAHQIIDVLPTLKQHAEWQIRNNLASQQPDGLVPGVIWMKASHLPPNSPPTFSKIAGHPPLWPIAVTDFAGTHGDPDLLRFCYPRLLRQIQWFEANRRASPKGFWYAKPTWESGLDDDPRQPFSEACKPRLAALDASCAVFGMYQAAAEWSAKLGLPAETQLTAAKALELGSYIQQSLHDPANGFFYDAWSIHQPDQRIESHVSIWPLVFGIADKDQAGRLIEEHILNPKRLFAKHPLWTIVPGSRGFQMLTWRGPAWNSMTYWAARGCLRYDRKDAARKLLESALDATAAQFKRTGTIWEFYDPTGGKPENLKREVKPPHQTPRRDYTGHNPLFAMVRMLESL